MADGKIRKNLENLNELTEEELLLIDEAEKDFMEPSYNTYESTS